MNDNDKWVPISEEMPEEYRDVFLTGVDDVGHRWHTVAKRLYSRTSRHLASEFRDGIGVIKDEDVTHWRYVDFRPYYRYE